MLIARDELELWYFGCLSPEVVRVEVSTGGTSNLLKVKITIIVEGNLIIDAFELIEKFLLPYRFE